MEKSNFMYYKVAWSRCCNLIKSEAISKSFAFDLLNERGLFVRNTYSFDKEESSLFWYVIKDEFGGFDELPTKVRNQIRKSIKTYEFKRVSYDEIFNEGYLLFNKSRERFGNNLHISLNQWEKRLRRNKNNDFWIGYEIESGKPASFAINTIFDDYVDYSTMGISPDFPNNTYPMYGLIYEMNRYYLEEKKVPFVCDGTRSITEHSNIQSVLEDKFKFRKAYCDLQVFYKPWLGVAVKLLFPFRKLIKYPKVAAILRQEAWTRGLEG